MHRRISGVIGSLLGDSDAVLALAFALAALFVTIFSLGIAESCGSEYSSAICLCRTADK